MPAAFQLPVNDALQGGHTGDPAAQRAWWQARNNPQITATVDSPVGDTLSAGTGCARLVWTARH